MVAWRMGQAPGLRTCCLKYCRQVNRVLRHGVVSSHRILFSNLEFSRQRATRARSLHPALLLFSSFFSSFLWHTEYFLACYLQGKFQCALWMQFQHWVQCAHWMCLHTASVPKHSVFNVALRYTCLCQLYSLKQQHLILVFNWTIIYRQ